MARMDAQVHGLAGTVDREAVLAESRRLRADGRLDEAARLAGFVAERFATDPRGHLELALALDAQRRYPDAIVAYQNALAMDLRGVSRVDCMVGLGQCLGMVGETRDALAVLASARQEFPHDGAVHAFYALALCAMRQPSRGAGELLATLLETTASGRVRAHEARLRAAAESLRRPPGRSRRAPGAGADGGERPGRDGRDAALAYAGGNAGAVPAGEGR